MFLFFIQKLAGATLLIFANKQDLAGALSFEDIADILDLRTLSEQRHVQVIVTQKLIVGF